MTLLTDESFNKHLKQCEDLPEPVLRYKQKAWEQFKQYSFPTRLDENWRYSSFKPTQLEHYVVSEPHASSFVVHDLPFSPLEQSFNKAVFVDDQLYQFYGVSEALKQKGVIWLPLMEAFHKYFDLIESYLSDDHNTLSSNKFIALQTAYMQSGMFLYVPADVHIETPFLCYHWLHNEAAAIFPYTLMIVEGNAEAHLVDFYASSNLDRAGFCCGRSTSVIKNSARVSRKAIQSLSDTATGFQIDSIDVGSESKFKGVALNLGGHYSRFENQVYLEGPKTSAELYALTVGHKDQVFDQRSLQEHMGAQSYSNLLYKNVLLDSCKTVFSGMIRVSEGAEHTDAYQMNRNLLLSGEAEADSLPGLEIKANEVKCSHGATTSEVDPDELFYMASRGIPSLVGQTLLVFGFFEEVITKIDDERLQEHIRNLLQQKFQRLHESAKV
jgi:Fe-S cluster assembly protein SufD